MVVDIKAAKYRTAPHITIELLLENCNMLYDFYSDKIINFVFNSDMYWDW